MTKSVSKVIKSGTLKDVAKATSKSGIGKTGVGTQKAGGTATKPGSTSGKAAGGITKSGAKTNSVRTSVAGKITVPGAKAGAKTGSGGGKRGTGTAMDNG